MAATSVLILGATSCIGCAVAHVYAAVGYDLILAARKVERLETTAADLMFRGAGNVRSIEFDILGTDRFQNFINALGIIPDIVVCAVGLLGNEKAAEIDVMVADMIMRTNYLGPALILAKFGNLMEQRGSGLIIGISSVAGDRGRASNYIYGSAKAGFTAFLSGLRNRLATKGVHVMTVKPGYVDTRMTAGLKLPKIITAKPEQIGPAIVKAAQCRKDVIYFYPIWRWIMLIIRLIPEAIFKKTYL
jgi:decaprenylphospho-beta-D-erythro-pentofuranosid-2-ulose 2-reductase